MAFDPVGPMYVAKGNPVTALGADMTQLRKVRQVAVDFNARMAWTSSDAQGGVPFADAMYTLASQPQATINLMDADVDQLALLVPNAVSTTAGGATAVGFPDVFQQILIADVDVFALVPSGQAADGAAAANALWLPAGTVQGPTGMTFGRINEGEIDNPFQITVQSAYRTEAPNAAAIPAGYRLGWMGPPSAVGLTWSLPALA